MLVGGHMKNILDFSLDELKSWMKDNNEKEFRAKQIEDFIYKSLWNFDEMHVLPMITRNKLNENFYIGIPKIVHSYESKLDGTKKFLLALEDGNLIECVLMKYNYGNSICVSTQVGCRMGCKFCASTVEGMIRNLTPGEILSQILVVQDYIKDRISNVVLMGSGEPLDNYENVLKFLELVSSEYGLNIGLRHITLSTCGIIPKMKDLADRRLQLTLAVSLHAASEDKRKEIMPIANKYSIADIIEACKYYIDVTGKRITFEYALIKSFNDSMEDARMLANLLKGLLCHVNLIPINQVRENDFEKSQENTVKKFVEILKRNGIEATVRREMGADINAACGQLRRSYMNAQI